VTVLELDEVIATDRPDAIADEQRVAEANLGDFALVSGEPDSIYERTKLQQEGPAE